MTAGPTLVLEHARIVTCDGPASAGPRAQLGIVEDASLVIEDGRITHLATGAAPKELASTAHEVVDVQGRVVLPGLVDPHTHLVFAGSRVDEFARKMAGEDYRAIASGGGGILSTVRATRAATDAELLALARARLRLLVSHGVTTAEIKSGYDLTAEGELRLLSIAKKLDADAHVTTTLLGAHALPPEFRNARNVYVELVAVDMIPRAARAGLADACDVYCDEGAFTLVEARRILEAARQHGLRARIHAGQFADLGAAELAAELGASCADHLEHVSDDGLRAMAAGKVVAVLLPGAWRTLRQDAPDAARMRAFGVRVAVGTDCNPGTSPVTDPWACAALAVRDAGLTTEEALLAVTCHAADAAGLSERGRLRLSGPGDLALFDTDEPRSLVYALSDVRATAVWRGGRRIDLGVGAQLPAHVWR